MSRVKELWERLQEMFKSPNDFEQWIASRNPQNAADVEHLYREWIHKNQFNQPF